MGDAGDATFAHAHVGEALGREVDIVAERLQHLRRQLGPAMLTPASAAGDVGHVDLEPPLGVVPEHLAVDVVDAGRRRRDVEVVLVQAAGDAVVHHHAAEVGHQHVARAAHRLLEVGESVHAVHELGRIRPPHVEPAEGGDIDNAHVVADVLRPPPGSTPGAWPCRRRTRAGARGPPASWWRRPPGGGSASRCSAPAQSCGPRGAPW